MKQLLTIAAIAIASFAVVACKDDKPVAKKSTWQTTCEARGGTVVKVEDSRLKTCKLPEENVEIDKEDPWFEKPPETVEVAPVKAENEVTYASDWDKEHVQKLDEKGIKTNAVQEKKVEEQKVKDEEKYGSDLKEIIAHAPNKKFKELCASKSGTFSKIHGGKWVCRYKE